MKYYLKVWLFTVLVSPFLVICGLVCQKSGGFSDIIEGLPIWFFAVMFGAVWALPALFLFRLLNISTSKGGMPIYSKKAVHAIVGFLLLLITFYFMNREYSDQFSVNNVWLWGYSLTLTIGTFIFKMQGEKV